MGEEERGVSGTFSGGRTLGHRVCRIGRYVLEGIDLRGRRLIGSIIVSVAGAVRYAGHCPGHPRITARYSSGSFLYVGTLTVVELWASDGRVMRTFVLDEDGRNGPRGAERGTRPHSGYHQIGTSCLHGNGPGHCNRSTDVLAKAHKHMSFDSTGALWVTTATTWSSCVWMP